MARSPSRADRSGRFDGRGCSRTSTAELHKSVTSFDVTQSVRAGPHRQLGSGPARRVADGPAWSTAFDSGFVLPGLRPLPGRREHRFHRTDCGAHRRPDLVTVDLVEHPLILVTQHPAHFLPAHPGVEQQRARRVTVLVRRPLPKSGLLAEASVQPSQVRVRRRACPSSWRTRRPSRSSASPPSARSLASPCALAARRLPAWCMSSTATDSAVLVSPKVPSRCKAWDTVNVAPSKSTLRPAEPEQLARPKPEHERSDEQSFEAFTLRCVEQAPRSVPPSSPRALLLPSACMPPGIPASRATLRLDQLVGHRFDRERSASGCGRA